MSDEPTNDNPTEGGAPAAEPTFSAADVERILAADREERGASAEDAVAKFRATATGSKLYAKPAAAAKPQPTQQNSELSELVQIAKATLAMNLAQMKPPTPPAPPKPMSPSQKLASNDPDVHLKRGPNAWTKDDTNAYVAELMGKGVSERDARRQVSNEIVAAGTRALASVAVNNVGSGSAALEIDINDLFNGRRK